MMGGEAVQGGRGILGTTYERWARGSCPCCGWNKMDAEGLNGTRAKAIGEGVLICGYCIENDHLEFDALTVAILEALITRSDDPIERAIEAARPARA